MASTTVEKVKVVSLTKFGFMDENNKAVYTSKTKDAASKAAVVPGRELEVELYIADSGARYLNKVVSQPQVIGAQVEPVVQKVTESVTKSTPKATATVSEVMTRADWDNKDLRISRQGAVQTGFKVAATIAPAPKLKEVAYKIADEIMEYVRGK
jgi:hypothetical protein